MHAAGVQADVVSYGTLPITVDGRIRHVFFCYVGEACSALKRGRAAMHAPHVEKFFDGTIGSLPTLTAEAELDERYLSALARQVCKGAGDVAVV